jgi:hypothetical protein
MGFQVGRNDDAEGIDCFDGSVPNELGEAEPTEPWQETMARLFEEQSKDPSGLFIIAIFIPLVALLLGRRVLRQWLDPNDLTGGSLSLEEVRRRQQQGYESRMNQDEVDSDTDSPFEEDDLNEEEKQQEMAVEPVSSSSSSSSS